MLQHLELESFSYQNSIYVFIHPSIFSIAGGGLWTSRQLVKVFLFIYNKDIIYTHTFQYSVINLQSILHNVKSEFKTCLQIYI